MALHPTLASFAYWSPAGEPIAAPREWLPALIAVPTSVHDWERARLTLQGQPLPLSLRHLAGSVRIVADWPRAGPGQYRLVLTVTDAPEVRQTVTVRPSKISSAAYEALLLDLEVRLPVAVALTVQRAGGLAGLSLPPPGESNLAQEIARLRRVVNGVPGERPGLATILAHIAADPHRMLHSAERWVSQHRARRPTPTRLPAALSRPGNWNGPHPQAIIDRQVVATVDVYENRLVALLVAQVQQRLRSLVAWTSLTADLRPEVEALLATVDQAQRAATFLSEVTRPRHLPLHSTMVLLKRPPYRVALAVYLELLRSVVVRLDAPDLSAPLENLPRLYQLWCTLQVISALLVSATEAGYTIRTEQITRRDPAGLFLRVLPNGQPALTLDHPTGGKLRLIPEATYSRGALRSISFAQRPDIAVELYLPGQAPAIMIFDPKYKLDGEPEWSAAGHTQPQKSDIDKMHAYRDAIRDATGHSVVTTAAILYPGPTIHYGPGVAALRAVPDPESKLAAELQLLLTAFLAR